MNVLDLSTNIKYLNKKPVTNMTNWIKNQIENLYNPVSAPMAATPEGLAERL